MRISSPLSCSPLVLALLGGCAHGTPASLSPAHADVTAPSPGIRVSGAAIGRLEPAITSFGALRVGADVVLVGGYSGTPHAYDRVGQHDAILRLGPDGTVHQDARLPYRVQSPTLVAHDGAIFVHGGMRATNDRGTPAHLVSEASVVRFAPDDAPRVVGSMPEGRSSHATAVVGESVFVVGGWTLEGRAPGRFATETLELDAHDGVTLRRRIPQPFRLRAHAAVALDDRIVVIGGMRDDESVSRATYLFDPSTGRFEEGPEFPGDAFGVAAVVHRGAVHASARDGRVHRLDLANGRWDEVARLAFPRFFHQLVSDGDGLLALGGIAGMSPDARASIVERVRVDGGASEPVIVELDAFGEARNRQGMAVVDGDLLLFGGNDGLDQHAFEPENFERDAFRVHLGSFRVESMPALPRPDQSFTTTSTADGTLYAIGGFGHTGTGTATRAEVLALGADGRFVISPMTLPEPRTQLGAHIVDGAVWILGGLDYDDARPEADRFRHFGDVKFARLPDGRFEDAGVALPGTRRAFASAVHEGRIYVFGGMREGFAPVADCGYVDVAQRSWHVARCPSAVRFSANLVALGDRLALVGGTVAGATDPNASATIELYDPATDRWSIASQRIPFSPAHVRAFAFEGRLLVASTHSEARSLRIAFLDLHERP